jgi:hypothetical protein
LQRENKTPAAREGGKEAERDWPMRVFFHSFFPTPPSQPTLAGQEGGDRTVRTFAAHETSHHQTV